jgi:hypothetical protein
MFLVQNRIRVIEFLSYRLFIIKIKLFAGHLSAYIFIHEDTLY